MSNKKNTIKLVSLNLWRFHDWEKRFPEIIRVIKEIDPDVIFTQETQRDISIDSRNQIEILNAELAYPYTAYEIADIKLTRKGVPLKNPVDHGLGVLSKLPFSSEAIELTKAADDKEKRIVLACKIMIGENPLFIANVHFSNSDRWAENHFKETLSLLKEKGIASVLAGDFNIFNIAQYKDAYGKDYAASSDQFEYISYPEDNASLDYILLPRNCSFKSFECRQEYLSDHRMLSAEIEFES